MLGRRYVGQWSGKTMPGSLTYMKQLDCEVIIIFSVYFKLTINSNVLLNRETMLDGIDYLSAQVNYLHVT